jgi:hypothetical protein
MEITKAVLWGVILGLVVVIVVNTSVFYAINAQTHYQITTKIIEEAGDNYSIKVSYPQINFYKSSQDKFNQYILSGIQSQIDDFKKTISQPINPMIPKNIKNELNIRYSLVGNDLNYISILFNKEEFYAGYAHPKHTLSSLNYEFKTGRNVDISELFKVNSNYVDIISNYAYRLFLHQIQSGQLDSTKEYLDQEGGTAPELKNFEVYGITDQALILYFQEYQVGPYVAGQPRIVIPYIVLTGVADPDGLLGPYIKNIH